MRVGAGLHIEGRVGLWIFAAGQEMQLPMVPPNYVQDGLCWHARIPGSSNHGAIGRPAAIS